MTHRVIQHPAVRQDIDTIIEFEAPRNLDAALRQIDAFEQTIQQLAKHPQSGAHPIFLKARRHTDIWFRVIAEFPNCLVFYREIEGVIEMPHVLYLPGIFPTFFLISNNHSCPYNGY